MKKIIALIMILSVVFTTALAHPFSDVASHWAEAEISAAYEKGIVEGDGSGSFRPDDNISRAEFLKIATAALASRFDIQIPDVENSEHWADKYNSFATQSYLYTNPELSYDGVSPAVMDKDSYDLPIRRWEMAYILDNAFSNVYGISGGTELTTSDSAEIDAAYDQTIALAIKSLVNFEIINGDQNGNFNPSNCGTRAEAISLINRSSKVMDEIEAYFKEMEEAYATQQEQALKAQEEALKASNITYNKIPTGHPVVEFKMSDGQKFEITLYPEYAPQTCANFLALVNANFYDGLTFHRIVEGFMAQGGDPNGDGTGGAENTIIGEFASNGFEQNTLKHEKGIVSMARSQLADSASSQFFICYDDATHLDGQYAAFGKVTKGMDTVESFLKVERTANAMGELASPVTPIKIASATVKKK